MSGIDLIVYGMLLAFTMIGTTEFVIGCYCLGNTISFRKKRKSSMAWYALYKWYKNWSKRNYPNMIDWYSEELNSPRWTKLDIYRLHQYKTK